jgi:DNA-binding MltR family transcriptional regulator
MGTLLDNALEALLGKFFIEDKTVEEINLFGAKGILDSMSKRRDLAYCLGLISGPVYENLDRLGRLRNHFAHNNKVIDFTDQRAKDLCNALAPPSLDFAELGKIVPNITEHLKAMTPEQIKAGMGNEWTDLDPRTKFTMVSFLIFMDITLFAESLVRRPSASPFLLNWMVPLLLKDQK